MTTLKKTKFRAILDLEEAIKTMIYFSFTDAEIKEIVRDILRQDARKRAKSGI